MRVTDKHPRLHFMIKGIHHSAHQGKSRFGWSRTLGVSGVDFCYFFLLTENEEDNLPLNGGCVYGQLVLASSSNTF